MRARSVLVLLTGLMAFSVTTPAHADEGAAGTAPTTGALTSAPSVGNDRSQDRSDPGTSTEGLPGPLDTPTAPLTEPAPVVPPVTTGQSDTAVPAPVGHYKKQARKVARQLGCVSYQATGRGEYHFSAGVCFLRERRVNVLTFRDAAQQTTWNTAVVTLGPQFFWANGKGAVVVARNGNQPAASLGARLLPGRLRHGR